LPSTGHSIFAAGTAGETGKTGKHFGTAPFLFFDCATTARNSAFPLYKKRKAAVAHFLPVLPVLQAVPVAKIEWPV
jgi:hypothetical protein